MSGARVPAEGAQSVLHAPRYGSQRGTSPNWSGYAVSGTNATHVVGTWAVPTVTCAAGESSWSSPWVGIDGDVSNTVEQVGTDSDCQKGTAVYYAWYEMYPKSAVVVPLTVSPGDTVTGEVTYSSGAFVLRLSDNKWNTPFTTTQQASKPQRTSVEWIVEGASNKPLSNFVSVSFSNASGTISPQTADVGVGSYGNAAEPITMVTNKGAPRAVPTNPPGATSFSVTWQAN
jgi:hypothetical protein